LNGLRAHQDIASIREDPVVQLCDVTIQNDAPWGLSRISSNQRLTVPADDSRLDFVYKYDGNGGGTTVYSIDTGIYIDHPNFEGRARWGKTVRGTDMEDRNGHGTHTAGTAVSATYGVAKGAEVVAVKIMDDVGDATASDLSYAIDWARLDALKTGKPSVISVNVIVWGGDEVVDDAAKRAYEDGVTVVAAAGNDSEDASSNSPARVEQAITVAASNILDTMTDTSNYGPSVNIFAAGYNVISTWNDGDVKKISGTSSATAHVAGLAAYLLGNDSSLTPAQVAETIDRLSLKNVLGGVPEGTDNKLLNNGL